MGAKSGVHAAAYEIRVHAAAYYGFMPRLMRRVCPILAKFRHQCSESNSMMQTMKLANLGSSMRGPYKEQPIWGLSQPP